MALQKCSSDDEAVGNIGGRANLTLTSTVLKRKSGGKVGGANTAPASGFQLHIYGYLFSGRMKVASPLRRIASHAAYLFKTFALIFTHFGPSEFSC
jgi:hypothetical protein